MQLSMIISTVAPRRCRASPNGCSRAAIRIWLGRTSLRDARRSACIQLGALWIRCNSRICAGGQWGPHRSVVVVLSRRRRAREA